MDMTRRFFAGALGSLPLAAAAASVPAATALARGADPLPVQPLARINIGKFTVTFLNDGFADIPYGFFTGQTPEAVQAAAQSIYADRDGKTRLTFTQYLIDDGERLVLVDAGPAGNIGETGRFPLGLQAIGVKPEDIDAIILTHAHFDHFAGLLADNKKVFPNAEVYLDRRDIAYFTDPARRAAAPDFLHSSFDLTEKLLSVYPNIQQIEGAHELVSGLSTIDLTGHTPGQIGVRIADGDESLTLVSDMMFHPAVHPVSATTGFVFEMDPAAAQAMRERFFPAAADEGTLIAATHMPFPGLGRIGKDNGKLRWVPADIIG